MAIVDFAPVHSVKSPHVAQQVTLAVITSHKHCLLGNGPRVIGKDHRGRVAHREAFFDKRGGETVMVRILVMIVAISSRHDAQQAPVIGSQHTVPRHAAGAPSGTVRRGVERAVLSQDKQGFIGSGERRNLRGKGEIEGLLFPSSLIGTGCRQQVALRPVIDHNAVQVTLFHRFVSGGIGVISWQVAPPLLGPHQQVGIYLVDKHFDFIILHPTLVIRCHCQHRLAREVELRAHRRGIFYRGIGLAGGTRDIEHGRRDSVQEVNGHFQASDIGAHGQRVGIIYQTFVVIYSKMYRVKAGKYLGIVLKSKACYQCCLGAGAVRIDIVIVRILIA